jgi:protein-disulfide isomerase
METQPNTSFFQGASPKLTYVFGLVTGIGATALLVLGFSVFGGKLTKSVAAANTNTTTTNTDTTAPTYGNVKAVSKDDYIRGDKNAKVTLVEYSDLECPFCKSFHPTSTKILNDYKGKVNLVFRHFPLSFHANAPKEAQAALCVASLGGSEKYFSFIDKIFERTTSNGTGFSLTALGPLAKEVGVNQAKFQDCLDSGKMQARVSAEEADGQQAGATGTPTTFVVKDGKTVTAIPGAYSYDQVKAIIDQAI